MIEIIAPSPEKCQKVDEVDWNAGLEYYKQHIPEEKLQKEMKELFKRQKELDKKYGYLSKKVKNENFF